MKLPFASLFLGAVLSGLVVEKLSAQAPASTGGAPSATIISTEIVAPSEGAPAPAPAAGRGRGGRGGARGPRAVKLTMRDGLRFDPPRISLRPGEEVELQIENGDSTDLAHNFLLLRPGTREAVVQQALALADKGPERGFIPDSPDILIQSKLLNADGMAKLTFTVPATPGIYPYVCTFPGHGMVMYGAIYAGVEMPALDKDPNIPPTGFLATIVGSGRRPYVQRAFMADAGPAAIAVALVGSQNFCWDAGQCRLRYAWQSGTFMDATEYFRGNGQQMPVTGAKPWWRAAKDEFPLRFDTPGAAAPSVQFLGYAATPTGPIFHYRAGQTEVFEQVLPAKGQPGLAFHLKIPNAKGTVYYRAANDENSQWTASTGTLKDGVLTLTPDQAKDFTLTLTSALCTP
jgi:azurin